MSDEQPQKDTAPALIPGISQDGKIALYGNVKAVNAIKARLCPEATPEEIVQFAVECDTTQLNPYRGQIYLVPRHDRRAGRAVCKSQVGIDGLRLISQRTGEFGGRESIEWCDDKGNWFDVWLRDTPPAAARCTVRKIVGGVAYPITNTVLYSAYVQLTQKGNPMARWKSDPAGQLAKCAEAGALRAAFPQEMGNLMTDVEMQQADNGHHEELEQAPRNVTPEKEDDIPTAATIEDPQEISEEEMAEASKPKPKDVAGFEESLKDDDSEQPPELKEDSPGWMDAEGDAQPPIIDGECEPVSESPVEDEGDGVLNESTSMWIEEKGLTAQALAQAACRHASNQAEGLKVAKALIEKEKKGAKFADLTDSQKRAVIHKAFHNLGE